MRLEDLLQQPEDEQLDFKRDMSSLNGIVKDICAFANTVGGILVIGVEDDRRVVGLDDAQQAEEQLMNVLSDRLEPRPTVQVRHASHNGADVLLVSLAFQAGPVHLKKKPLDEGTYGRYGSTSRVVDPGRLAELRRYRESRTWDELPCPGAVREDLDEELAERVFGDRGADFSEAALRTCRLLVDQGGALVPSNAGIVLFGRDRAKHYLGDARWRCIRYPGVTKSSQAIFPQDFDDLTVVEALGRVEAYIQEHGGSHRDIQGLDRTDVSAFSDRVVREVLINAIAHANYQVTGSRLDVSIYADRIEVQSPGTWPPGYRFEDLKDGVSQVRNRAISRTLRTLRYMEEQGTAWARVEEAAAEGYPEPRWESHGPVLRVIVPKHPQVVSTSQMSRETFETSETTGTKPDGRAREAEARHDRILAILRERAPEDVAVADIPRLTGASRATTYRDIETLRAAGAIRDTARGRVAVVPEGD
jgi:ATP-dependent DNA helicase RecG